MKWSLPTAIDCELCGERHEVRKANSSDVIDPLSDQKGLVNCEKTGRIYEVTEQPEG